MGPEGAKEGFFVSFVVHMEAPRFCRLNILNHNVRAICGAILCESPKTCHSQCSSTCPETRFAKKGVQFRNPHAIRASRLIRANLQIRPSKKFEFLTLVTPCFNQKNPRVRKIVCPLFWGRKWLRQVYGRLEKCVLSARKAHVHKIPRFRRGGILVFFGGGGRFYFHGRTDFSNLNQGRANHEVQTVNWNTGIFEVESA